MPDPDKTPTTPPKGPTHRAIFIERDTPNYSAGRVLIDRDGSLAAECGDACRPATPAEIGIAGLSLEISE